MCLQGLSGGRFRLSSRLRGAAGTQSQGPGMLRRLHCAELSDSELSWLSTSWGLNIQLDQVIRIGFLRNL